jgi:putative ABC transport system permease protein
VSAGFGPAARIRHFAIAYGRGLAATRLLSAIAILGLAIGLAGAILMALAARTALGFNTYLPDHDRIYLGISVLSGPGMPANYEEASNGRAAALIRANLTDVEAVARLAEDEVDLRRGASSERTRIYWADPGIFDLLRLPPLHGDARHALDRPDGLVMTRSEAIRLFGRADALGSAIDLAGQPMVLRAVVADPPAHRTDLTRGIFASGLATRSALAQPSAEPGEGFSIGARTYMRLRPGAAPAAVERGIGALITGLLPLPMRGAYAMRLVRIDRLTLHEGFHPEARERLRIGSLVAGLILFIAIANFVNLSVAMSARRRREIGVRKANGASRGQIAAQFLGEAVATVLIAGLIAASAVELILPRVNAFLGTEAMFDYLEHPALLVWLGLGAVAIGLAAGAYPALLLASLSPIAVLRDAGPLGRRQGRGWLRGLLVTGQFAILIGLLIALVVVWQQRSFAMREALRVDIDQMLIVEAPCPAAFGQEVARLLGVRGVSCSGAELLDGSSFAFLQAGGERVPTDFVSMLPGGFAIYGVTPIAGTLATLPPAGQAVPSRVVINRTAARRFGFSDPAAAIGQTVPIPPDGGGADIRVEVVAVVPDFALTSVETAIKPTLYLDRPAMPGGAGIVSIKLAGRDIPETLAAIDELWRSTGQSGPIRRSFVSEHLERLYRDLARNTALFAVFAGIAAFLASLGLVGLSVSAAERRTREIGIRKALGARTGQIVTLLLFEMSRPVLLANLIAWPVAWWTMRAWLNGFAYHVPLHLWLFPAAGVIAFLLALASIGSQSWQVARRKPIDALRHE